LWADKSHDAEKPLTTFKSFIIGIAQAFAILPGVSRSGATISMALLLNIDRVEAARFSFLMVVPLIFGKILKDVMDGALVQPDVQQGPLMVGFITAFFAGFIACKWMIQIVRKAKLAYFAIYCTIIGLISITVALGWF
jgi:undecaprenyl-diphosphatase